MNYHVSQFLTDHGSFGHFLLKIRKRRDESCPHCGDESDTVEHTLAACPAWEENRTRLLDKIGPVAQGAFTLEYVVGTILKSEENWSAFSRFAQEVVKSKEEDERVRELGSPAGSPVDP
ncbi:reverse transcriptase [Lasius niger]|uniref:Reverse transcriptase n=1 Tax=Lasius niger TaxID=67767 RepID=A0A0J7KCR6_LASNI|nr:reverse transcriptase [Lasius niger]